MRYVTFSLRHRIFYSIYFVWATRSDLFLSLGRIDRKRESPKITLKLQRFVKKCSALSSYFLFAFELTHSSITHTYYTNINNSQNYGQPRRFLSVPIILIVPPMRCAFNSLPLSKNNGQMWMEMKKWLIRMKATHFTRTIRKEYIKGNGICPPDFLIASS